MLYIFHLSLILGYTILRMITSTKRYSFQNLKGQEVLHRTFTLNFLKISLCFLCLLTGGPITFTIKSNMCIYTNYGVNTPRKEGDSINETNH